MNHPANAFADAPGDQPGAWSIRPLRDPDRSGVLHLNADSHPAVHLLDEATLSGLLGFGGHQVVATDPCGAVIGYLLAVPSTSGYQTR